MLFILFHISFSRQIFDYTKRFKSNQLTIYMFPLDEVEIKMKNNSGVFFSQFSKNLYLDIEVIKSDKNIDTHGSFDKYNALAGFISKKNYFNLRLTNEGRNTLSLSMIFTLANFPDINDFNNSDIFPIFRNTDINGEIKNGINFYYGSDDLKSFIPIYIFLGFFVLYYVIAFTIC